METEVGIFDEKVSTEKGVIMQWWSVVAQFGFWGWVFAAAGFILSAFPHRNTFRSSGALGWGVPFLFFYTAWIIGMLRA